MVSKKDLEEKLKEQAKRKETDNIIKKKPSNDEEPQLERTRGPLRRNTAQKFNLDGMIDNVNKKAPQQLSETSQKFKESIQQQKEKNKNQQNTVNKQFQQQPLKQNSLQQKLQQQVAKDKPQTKNIIKSQKVQRKTKGRSR